MRNLSMKKFGTPIGAGPTVASEYPGFAGVGTPSGSWSRGVSRRRGRAAVGVGVVAWPDVHSLVEVEA